MLMLKIVLIVAAVIALLLISMLAYAATKPDHFRVTRSIVIDAPPEAIYPLVADFHEWPAWSPFEEVDPQAKKTYSGTPAGAGAVYEWQGNSEAGQGRIEITEARTGERLAMALHMIKPFDCRNDVLFTFSPGNEGTRVTWQMEGKQPYLGKVFSLFCNVDKMCGDQFEKGLASLKGLAENEAKVAAAK